MSQTLSAIFSSVLRAVALQIPQTLSAELPMSGKTGASAPSYGRKNHAQTAASNLLTIVQSVVRHNLHGWLSTSPTWKRYPLLRRVSRSTTTTTRRPIWLFVLVPPARPPSSSHDPKTELHLFVSAWGSMVLSPSSRPLTLPRLLMAAILWK